jgi:dipeptidase E
MHQMRRSGFEQVIKELLKEDRIVYAGESAGACVIGSSLRGLEEADEPEFAERVIWEGLSILPNFILPHTDNPMFAADIKYAREVHKDDRQPVIELTDSQALVINGAESEIVEKTEP